MPTISFGKRQRFTDIASHALTERIVPPFLMRRLPGFFTNTPMGFLGKYRPIGLPKITGTDALAEHWRNAAPQMSTGTLTAVANHKGHNVTRASQQRRPEPAFVHAFPDETPGVIDVQHVLPLRSWKRLFQ